MPEYKTIGQYNPSNLITGSYPLVTESITVEAGQTLASGSVLGKVTATNEYKLSAAGSSDGSELPSVILAEDIDTTGGAAQSVGFISGQFNANALIFGTGHTAESQKHNLRLINIYLTNVA